MHKIWLVKTIALFGSAVIAISAFYKFVIIDRTYGAVDYTLSQEIDTIVVGGSHLAIGFDDTKYPNVENFSNSGMPYFFTYPKTKKLLDNNEHIKKVIVSLSLIHVSPYGDSNLFSTGGFSRKLAFLNFPLLDETTALGRKQLNWDFLLAYGKYNLGIPFNYIDDLPILAKSLRGPVAFTDTDFSGSYVPYEESGLTDATAKDRADFYVGDYSCSSNDNCFSSYAIDTLKRTAKLADEKEVDLYIVTMPMHESFTKHIPDIYSKEQDRLIAGLTDQYSNITYLDYEKFDLEQEDFLDADHINVSGVKKLAKSFEQDIIYHQ